MICRRLPGLVLAASLTFAMVAAGQTAGSAGAGEAPPRPQPGAKTQAGARSPLRTAPAAGLRIDGTFIQIQDWMLKLDAEAWRKELEAIRQAHMDVIVLQFAQKRQTRFFKTTASAPADAPSSDLVQLTLDFANKNHMEVFIGLLDDGEWFKRWKEPAYLDQLADNTNRLADELWQLFGKHRSLAGWYIPTETWDGPYTDEQVANLRKFFRTVSDHCAKLGPGPKPVAIAPYCPGRSTPAILEKTYTAMLTNAGVDIVMLQDGVGARGLDGDLLEIVPFFRAMRNACLAAGCELWADLECFKLIGREDKRKVFAPADAERIGWQMSIEAPFVQKIVTFDFFHYMSPYRNEVTKKLNADYMARYVERNWLPALGPGPTIDPVYPYYRDRSPESIAAEIRASGYGVVHYVLSAESTFDPGLLNALHRERIGVWYMTWGNGTYSTADLPTGWESWKMVTRTELAGGKLNDGFTRLCLNNTHYRAWRKRQIAQVMRRAPFEGVEIVEPHWPDYPGVECMVYGCFCRSCQAAFTKMFPDQKALPDILHGDAPTSPNKNPQLWKKWLQFRQASVTDFLNDLVNGKGGIRQTVPHAAISVWSLALKDGIQRVREDNGEDAEDIARMVKPDLYGLQTHWPDWIKPDLPPDYIRDYAPFIAQVRKAAPAMPILIQADTGSNKQNRRSWTWIASFERACWKLGVTSTTFYEYFIGQYMYDDPPRVTEVRRRGRQVALVFTKRLDPASAGNVGNYELDEGSVTAAKVDGNVVELSLSRVPAGRLYELKVKEISDAADRRLIRDQAPAVLKRQTVRFRY